MGTPENAAPLLNIANILTMVRIVLIPFFLLALFAADGQSDGWRVVAGIVFAFASFTDRIDGQLARKYGLVTNFGKIADPIADKALVGGALVGLSMLGFLSWWITAIIIVRELGITVLRFWVIKHGVIPASRGGKLKTLVQSVAIGMYIVPLPDSAAPLSVTLMGLAVLLTVVTGIDYIVQALRMRAAGNARQRDAQA